MADADRIPIDIGYDVASTAEASDPRVTVREDGTIVIDILASAPCAPDPTTEQEIVVCAQAPDAEPPQAPPPPAAPSLTQRMGDALTFKIGALELGLIDRGDGQRAMGGRIRY